MASVAQPAAGALETALAPCYYTDPAVFARERETIFLRSWQYAGHLSRLAQPGDYVTERIVDQGVVVIRGHDGALRAFYNVCRHRGHELLAGEGNAPVVICPYHAWTYATDGRLRKAPYADRVPGFDRRAICLTPVRHEVLGGFVFVNLDDAAPAMAEVFAGVEGGLRAFLPELDALAPAHRVVVEERCNWKVSVENYSECYHCRGAHPTFASGVIDADSYNVTVEGRVLRHTTHAAATMGYAIGGGAHAADYSSWFLWPNFSFQVYPGGVLNTYRWEVSGPESVTVVREWFAPGGEATPELLRLAAQDRETTVAEDLRIVEAVQRGLASRGYRPGPLVIDPAGGVNSEHSILALKRWLLEAFETGHPYS